MCSATTGPLVLWGKPARQTSQFSEEARRTSASMVWAYQRNRLRSSSWPNGCRAHSRCFAVWLHSRAGRHSSRSVCNGRCVATPANGGPTVERQAKSKVPQASQFASGRRVVWMKAGEKTRASTENECTGEIRRQTETPLRNQGSGTGSRFSLRSEHREWRCSRLGRGV